MTLPLTVDPDAQSEISEAAVWYEDRVSGLGTEFVAAIDRALSMIADDPERYPVWTQDHPFRRHLLHRFPYVVFYEAERDRVVYLGRRTRSSSARLLDLA